MPYPVIFLGRSGLDQWVGPVNVDSVLSITGQLLNCLQQLLFGNSVLDVADFNPYQERLYRLRLA